MLNAENTSCTAYYNFHTFQVYSSFCIDFKLMLGKLTKLRDIFKWGLLSKPIKPDKPIKANKTLSAIECQFVVSNGVGSTWVI